MALGPSDVAFRLANDVGTHNSLYITGGFDHGAGHPFLFLDDAKALTVERTIGSRT